MKLLLTGATGKVGQNFLTRFLGDDTFKDVNIVALCHNRSVPETSRVTVVSGSLADPASVAVAMKGVTHVVHLAAVKESPDLAIDVSVKGMFLLLEQARRSSDLQRFLLLSGDCSVGHIFHDYPDPITETAPLKAYQGCYALTKVIEEVMLEQYNIQYGLEYCTLRAPWIMEKDDLRFALSFGADQFGGPAWTQFIPQAEADTAAQAGKVPLMLDGSGRPLKRNFVHVDDLVSAILVALHHEAAANQLFNISMNEPLDYAAVAEHLARTRGIEAHNVPTPFHSNWLDNTKARHALGWRPEADLEALVERAWTYQRDPADHRKIWYPG